MFFVVSQTDNPAFNIAAEEYFLKNFDEDFFYLYINQPSLIVGKHQNAVAEINVPFVMEQNIQVVRRLSGGGTVYHDAGNLNYCFIQKGQEGYLVDFKKYSQPILDALQQLGVNAYLRGKSDLVIDDLKFSGNAEHVFRNKVLHHGTLLFNSDLTVLNEAIKNDWNRFEDKAVRSNRSMVTNIIDYLNHSLSLDGFKEAIIKQVEASIPEFKSYVMKKDDMVRIQALIDEKYGKWNWNFGYSPKFKLNQVVEIKDVTFNSVVEVHKGVIQNVAIYRSKLLLSELSEFLKGKEHNYFSLSKELSNWQFDMDSSIIIKLLF